MMGMKKFGLDREPTYKFEVGEHVRFGNMDDAVVVAVHDNNREYDIHTKLQQTRRGENKLIEGLTTVCWHEIRKLEAGEDTCLRTLDNFKLRFSNRELRSLIHTYYAFGIDDSPDYQRGNVWELEDKVELIKSVFAGADIGKFLLNEVSDPAPQDPVYEIVDGKQRLHAIIDFYEDRYDVGGFTFSQLSNEDRLAFLRHDISVGELIEADKVTVLKCFLRMNRGGKPMDPEHIKKVEAILERTTKPQ